MDPQDTAPDSWEQEDDVEATAVDVASTFAGLNVNAPEFVPTFLQGGPSVIPVPDGKFMWQGKKHRLDSFRNSV